MLHFELCGQTCGQAVRQTHQSVDITRFTDPNYIIVYIVKGITHSHLMGGSALTSNFGSFLYLQTNACYAFGGVPSAFDTTASIWIKASSGKADTPTVLRAGTPPGKNVV